MQVIKQMVNASQTPRNRRRTGRKGRRYELVHNGHLSDTYQTFIGHPEAITGMVKSGRPMRAFRLHLKVQGRLHGLTHRIGRDKGIFKDSFGAW